MAETQANKLRARTRDALGPKVRGSLGCHPAPCMAVQVLQLIQPPFFLSAQGVMPAICPSPAIPSSSSSAEP